ncbi:protein CDI-like, partial [Asparagus officinalis]|uniref:protein CDI-like n=1 Tax=Asparagus officinalis TaxID=4686 RepID=UPI00098DFC40
TTPNLLQNGILSSPFAVQDLHRVRPPRGGGVRGLRPLPPQAATKMDGAVQTVYPRKNWSSMVLYNCAHPKNRVLTPELVSRESGAFLHRFMWLDDGDIGEVPSVWNFLVGHNRVEEGYPKAIHYTMGGPWFDRYRDCEFADLWLKELEEMESGEKKGEGQKGKDQKDEEVIDRE